MSITTSYPGVYVQELPSLAHAVTPAPTSVTVFVGYTHPFLTKNFGVAVELFSFADYLTNFGGFFSSPWLPDYLGNAVFQFFQNGGADCYVVGVQPTAYWDDSTTPATNEGVVQQATAVINNGGDAITFTALQPVGVQMGVGIPMTVQLLNVTQTTNPDDTADVLLSYGTQVEMYRKVQIGTLVTKLQASSLATVALSNPSMDYPSPPPAATAFQYTTAPTTPSATYTNINLPDVAAVFTAGGSLDKVPIFNLLVTPGITDPSVTADAIAFCEEKRAFYIMDTPSSASTGWDANSVVQDVATSTALVPPVPSSINAAIYYPWLVTTDPVTGSASTAPPSGFVAGMYAQEDANRGVWKSPAGIETTLLGTTGVEPNGVMNDAMQGVLNPQAINCLRQFPGIGTVIFGARTTAGADNAAQPQWKYLAVRRMALFIEQSLYASLKWAVFEPNATPLWQALTQEVTAFMLSLFRQGAFAGDTPSTAFVVQCDSTTTTQNDIALGRVNVLVGFAPLEPAEFVVIQISQLAGQAQS